MHPVTVSVARFRALGVWTNRILRVDLSSMRAWVEESAPRVPEFLGGRGLAARLAWEDYPAPVEPFDPASPLMLCPGALTGSKAPYAGRANICGFAPQAWPYHWFSRASIGKHLGGELKRAGYDALVVTGAAEEPVRLRIRDDEVSILPAPELWGRDTFETLEALEAAEGPHARAAVIGPAGERLSRIATIQTASSSAAGQGGYGAVMGSKRLKAISVVGTGQVPLAHPERVAAIAHALARQLPHGPSFFGRDLAALNRALAQEGNGRARVEACTEGCVTPCCAYFEDVPGAAFERRWSGAWFCVATGLVGTPRDSPERAILGWQLSRRAAFEVNVLANRYGLNEFELVGLATWLIACQKAGLVDALDGRPPDWDSPAFWAHLLHAIAYREASPAGGLSGDVLAEGGWAAAQALHLGEDLAARFYAGWGQCGHWDGRLGPNPHPFWLASALQWLQDTRDPYNSGHGHVIKAALGVLPRIVAAKSPAEREAALAMARRLGERAYGSPDTFDPYSGYAGKAEPAYRDTLRAQIKDGLPVDDLVFPLVWDGAAPDGLFVLRDVDGLGNIPGPEVEYALFREGTGLDWSPEEFWRAGRRAGLLERALAVRHWDRDRTVDELVLPYFQREELSINPLLGERHALDRERFRPVQDEFYRLWGWDTQGQPTREALEEVGLAEVYAPMVEGAERARAAASGVPAQ